MKRVVVIGRDAPLWLTAATLSRALPKELARVSVISLPSGTGDAQSYATQPALEALHARIGLDEATVLRATSGSYSLGQNVVGGGLSGFFHAWSAYGAPIDGFDFFPQFLRARSQGLDAAFQQFSLGAIAALNGRMMVPGEASDRFGRCDYGYHLPARAYAMLLERLCARLQGDIWRTSEVHLACDTQNGRIKAIELGDGTRVEGDIFIDTTREAVVARRVPGSRVVRRAASGPVRCLTASVPPFRKLPAFSELRFGKRGFAAIRPSASFTSVSYHFASGMDDQAALLDATKLAGSHLGHVAFDECSTEAMEAPWTGNCLAIGPAAGCSANGFQDTELHSTQLGIVHFLNLFPAGDNHEAARREYNRIIRSSLSRIEDFQQAFLHLAPLGADGAALPSKGLSPELAHKIDTFRATGDIAPFEDESFSADSWRALFTGLGIWPERWTPTADRLEPAALQRGIRDMLAFISDTVLRQPDHTTYLNRVSGPDGAAIAPETAPPVSAS